jgi:hypothetical protein
MIMDLEATKALLKSNAQLAVLIIYTDENGKVQQFQSDNFKQILLE